MVSLRGFTCTNIVARATISCSPHPPLVHLALVALPIGRPQLELLELARGRAGQLVAELDALRHLVPGEARPAVLAQLVLGDLVTRGLHDEGQHELAPLLV